MKTIFYVAGKSGGHIIPALTLAQQQQTQAPTTIGIFSTDASLDTKLIAPCSAIAHHIPLSLSGVSLKHPLFLLKIIRVFVTSLRTLRRHKPEVVISTGGLVSVPVCAAAWLLRIPYELYEFNVEPGAAVKFLSPRAKKVYTCFAATKLYLRGNLVAAAYPVRYAPEERISQEKACSLLQLPNDKKILMIIGGSQGSRFLNMLVQQFVLQLSAQERSTMFIIHQTGAHNAIEMRQFYSIHAIEALIFDYRDDIALCYQAADFCITRAGSGVLHELLFFNQRALIIPLEVATTSHQVANAQAFVERDPASWTMLRQQDLQQDEKLLYRHVVKKLL